MRIRAVDFEKRKGARKKAERRIPFGHLTKQYLGLKGQLGVTIMVSKMDKLSKMLLDSELKVLST